MPSCTAWEELHLFDIAFALGPWKTFVVLN